MGCFQMRNIEVKVLHESHTHPGQLMASLARLTQRGHNIKNMAELEALFARDVKPETVRYMADLPHGTIRRFTPITVAIVGASRRFLAQARTHHAGMTFVSASLQYSDYTGEADFVVPYEMTKYDIAQNFGYAGPMTRMYLKSCEDSMRTYANIAKQLDGDTAGYAAPQGLRNILIVSGNHEAWLNFINKRSCSRNTDETQYVALRIWEALEKTADGKEMFAYAGPDCMYGTCREGKLSCGEPFYATKTPSMIISERWPLL